MSVPVRRLLETRFPNLKTVAYKITNPPTRTNSCFAWAANELSQWWEPIESPGCYWPQDLPHEYSLENYVAAFGTLGYSVCKSDELQTDIERVAIYVKDALPTHAARQLVDGGWTSKLGTGHDIQHASLHGIEGEEYGSVGVIRQRSRTQ